MLVRLAVIACVLAACMTPDGSAQTRREPALGEPRKSIDQAPDATRRPSQAAVGNEPGYLGLITDDRRDEGRGIRVVKVVEGSPAAAAGFRADDLILAIDGTDVRSLNQMARELEPRISGDKVRFEVRRASESVTIDVTLGHRPARDQRQFEFGRIPERLPGPVGGDMPLDFGSREGLAAPRGQLLGVRTAPVTEEIRQRLALRELGGAVVVSRILGSPAERAGIPLDAVIVAVDGHLVTSPLDLARLVGAAGPAKEVEIAYVARGQEHKATVKLAEAADGGGAMPGRPLPEIGPQPVPFVPGDAASQRIDLLERRVRELEQRVQELERLLRQRG